MENHNITDVLASLKELYIQEKYDKAVDLLLQNKDKFDPAIFHYNLGSLFLKKQKPSLGRFHLEKAKKAGFSDPSLFKNLRTSIQEMPEVIAAEKVSPAVDWAFNISSLPIEYFLCISISMAIAHALYVLKGFKANYLTHIVSILLVCTITIAPKWAQSRYTQGVTLSVAEVREGPSSAFDVSAEVPAGLKLVFTKKVDDWLYVVHPSNLVGWVRAKKIGVL